MGFFEGRLEELTFEANETGEDNPEIPVLKAQVSKYFGLGLKYAMRALEVRNPGIGEKMKNIATMDSSIEDLKEKDVPALFFYAFNTAMYAYHNMDSMKAIATIHMVENALKRVIELDETYFHGLAHLALFALNARSPMLGGNLELSMKHYKRLKEIVGDDFYLADVQFARFYLYTTQDRKQFKNMLNNVLDNYESARPEYRMYNKMAALKAKVYLKYMDQLFL
jgi:TRAP transporter TatT component family protein